MLTEMAIADEFRDGRLQGQRDLAIERAPHGARGIDELIGHDEEAEPEARRQDLAQRADIEHAPAIAVERLERGDWLAVIAKLAVVIVLDDVAGGLAGPCR